MSELLRKVQELIQENCAGESEIFLASVAGFLETLESTQTDFTGSCESANLERIATAAHRLRGDTSLFHFPAVSHAFADIEEMARNGQLPSQAEAYTATELLNQLADELKEIQILLKK